MEIASWAPSFSPKWLWGQQAPLSWQHLPVIVSSVLGKQSREELDPSCPGWAISLLSCLDPPSPVLPDPTETAASCFHTWSLSLFLGLSLPFSVWLSLHQDEVRLGLGVEGSKREGRLWPYTLWDLLSGPLNEPDLGREATTAWGKLRTTGVENSWSQSEV